MIPLLTGRNSSFQRTELRLVSIIIKLNHGQKN
uniref:Uncharacterized protein n=1 Tax=Rhizophora mucronata TaxID=61149 RepID=A0A2P2L1Z5_RHIMU